jgi:pyruvate formate lyase activating enzyme
MVSGLLFDIKHYAVHDGPGIRTTLFFKGCPLRCWWCHNPEGISPEEELNVKPQRCLEDCRLCLSSCPENALSKPDGKTIQLDREKCRTHTRCSEICPTGALEKVGKTMTVTEVMQEVNQDRIFYERSGGGITFSGGEPLQQPEFLDALLTACKKVGLHTVLDTSGHAPFALLERIRDRVDLFFYDLKHMDPDKHREMTGVSNSVILDNLKRLAKTGNGIRIRVPLITGVNDDDTHIRQMGDFLTELPGIRDISLLPYHSMGSQKYSNLDLPYLKPEAKPPTEEAVAGIKAALQRRGFRVKIGG